VARADGDDVIEGALLCPACSREHPIVDGIPIVVADLVSWGSHQLDALLRRDDLDPFTESLLGDVAGPGGGYDRERSNLSGYGHGHWGGGAYPELLVQATALLDEPPSGAWVDLGCAVGRGTLELARTCELAVGVDLSFGMLRVAERVRREGRAVFPLRRTGVVYDRTEVEVPDVPADRMSFWCCDVGALPFADGSFAGALSLNVLDCAASPAAHLTEMRRVITGHALLSTPYDWSPAATPFEQWIGGHSQRGDDEGSSAKALRRYLPQLGFAIEAEREVPWSVYANERSRVQYDLHLMRLSRSG
jgi:SAM-dependent methyltransferase